MPDLRYRLSNGPTIVGDAPKGTRLLGHVSDRLDINVLNLRNPQVVSDIHRRDLEAGAQAIMTNTWDAPYLIPRLGEDQVFALSKRGVEIARDVAGDEAYVIATMGPVAWSRNQFEEIGNEIAKRSYEIPLHAFKEASVDGIVLETFTWGPDLVLAYQTAREVMGGEIPIIALFGKVTRGSTPSMGGIRQLSNYLNRLKGIGADSIGVNCSHYNDALMMVRRLSAEVDVPLTVSVNVTKDTWRGEREITISPEKLGELVPEYVRNQAGFIYVCCGGNESYVHAISNAVNTTLRDIPKVKPRRRTELKFQRQQSGLEKALLAGENVLCIEPRAPQQIIYEGDEPAVKLIDALFDGGQVFYLNLTDCAGGVPSINPMVWGARLQNTERFNAKNLEIIVHIACFQATPDKIESEMFTGLSIGIRNILVLGGDTIYGSGADEVGASMLEVLANRYRSKFFTGVSLDISVDDATFKRQLTLLRDKVNLCLGMENLNRDPSNQTIVPVFTQVVYDVQTLQARYRLVREKFTDEVKLIVGVYPLLSHDEATEFMENFGVKIPIQILKMYQGKSQEEQRQVGIAIAKEIVEFARRRADGIYLIQPKGGAQKAAQTMLEILAVS